MQPQFQLKLPPLTCRLHVVPLYQTALPSLDLIMFPRDLLNLISFNVGGLEGCCFKGHNHDACGKKKSLALFKADGQIYLRPEADGPLDSQDMNCVPHL